MYCKNCGKEIDDRAAICPHCGVPVQTASQQPSTPGLCIAGFVLAILSVWFGVLVCIPPVLAIVLSSRGIRKAKENGSRSNLGTAGLVIGIITTVFWGIVYLMLIITAIASP